MIFLVLLCMIVCGGFWRLGGMDESKGGNDYYRTWGCPSVVALVYFIISGSWWSLLFIPMGWAAIQFISYGENAEIQNFWEFVIQGGSIDHNYMVEFCTRLTCSAIWCIPSILFVYLCNGSMTLFVPFFILRAFAMALVGALVPNAMISEWAVGILYATVVCI